MSLPQAKMPVDNPHFVMSWYGDCFERVDINFEPCVSIIPQEFQALGNRSAIVKSVRDREELLTAELNDVLKLGARYVRLAKGLTYLQDISQYQLERQRHRLANCSSRVYIEEYLGMEGNSVYDAGVLQQETEAWLWAVVSCNIPNIANSLKPDAEPI
jgi:hypothetical protein